MSSCTCLKKYEYIFSFQQRRRILLSNDVQLPCRTVSQEKNEVERCIKKRWFKKKKKPGKILYNQAEMDLYSLGGKEKLQRCNNTSRIVQQQITN